VAERLRDLRDCPTAYECRDRLPELSAWMTDELLKQLPIWQGGRFERGQEYFDLDNPERGPFVATGEEAIPTDFTYVCQDEVSPAAWSMLITWRQPVSEDQGRAIDIQAGHATTPPVTEGNALGAPSAGS
jgi:hypothetical protein